MSKFDFDDGELLCFLLLVRTEVWNFGWCQHLLMLHHVFWNEEGPPGAPWLVDPHVESTGRIQKFQRLAPDLAHFFLPAFICLSNSSASLSFYCIPISVAEKLTRNYLFMLMNPAFFYLSTRTHLSHKHLKLIPMRKVCLSIWIASRPLGGQTA